MSKTKEHKSDDNKSRVQVGNLQRKEKELKNQEAESVKGGGGAAGGVVLRTHIGEEIPSWFVSCLACHKKSKPAL